MPLVLTAGAVDVIITVGIIVFGTLLSAVIVPPLVGLLRQIPVVGGQIAGSVDDFFKGAQGNIRNWWDDSVGPLVQLVYAPINAFSSMIDGLVGWGDAVTNMLIALGASAGGAVGSLVDTVQQLVGKVGGLLTAVATITVAITHLPTTIAAAILTIVPDLISEAIAGLRSFVLGKIDLEAALRAAAVSGVVGLVNQLVAQAEAAALAGDQELAHQLAHTAASLSAAIAAAEATAIDYADQVADTLGIQITDIRKVAIPAAVAPLIATITGIATTITNLDRECIQPTCAARSAGLDLFALLQAGVELAFIVGLLQAAISDPAKTGRDLANGVDDIVGVAHGVLSALGIRV